MHQGRRTTWQLGNLLCALSTLGQLWHFLGFSWAIFLGLFFLGWLIIAHNADSFFYNAAESIFIATTAITQSQSTYLCVCVRLCVCVFVLYILCCRMFTCLILFGCFKSRGVWGLSFSSSKMDLDGSRWWFRLGLGSQSLGFWMI